jgi:DNA-binding NarL/FixJ family response regulator
VQQNLQRYCVKYKVFTSSKFSAAELREAGSGEEGLYQIDTLAPQMIFIDIYLPDISGLELARKIRETHSEIIMAIFASFDSPEYQATGSDSGVEHLIPKDDSTVKDILALVESVLSGTRISQF